MAEQTQLVELVDVHAADGLALAGAFAMPQQPDTNARFDAVLMMHGAGGRFFDAFYHGFSAALLARGVATLRANNRGHDIVNRGNARGAFAGTAFEALEACVLDWRAWIDLLAARGYRRVLVFGHSLGAVKSAYYLATERDARVAGCVLASPPRFNTGIMLASDRGSEFAKTLDEARALVAAGRPEDLVRTTFPLRSFAGAAAYLAKYGAGARFDVLALLGSIACPVLGLTGANELADPTFCDHPAGYAAARALKPDLDFALVPDGDHHYSGDRAQTFAVQRFLAWIDA